MPRLLSLILAAIVLCQASVQPTRAAADDAGNRFQPMDVFHLEYATDPQISPDGRRVAYVRNFMDVMKDRRRSNLWIVDKDGSNHRAITSGSADDVSPRWSPDGTRLLYVASHEGKSQLFCRWMDTGETARLTNLTEAPGDIAWSPDGRQIAMTLRVPEAKEPFAEMPKPPAGAEWADSFKVIRTLVYRADGKGFLKGGFQHVFVVPAEGGTPRQLTDGEFNHHGPLAWTSDGRSLIVSSNRNEDWEYDPRNSELYRIEVGSGKIVALTTRQGPDHSPAVSPDGRKIAWLGHDDKLKGFQVSSIHVMNADGKSRQVLNFNRSVQTVRWSSDSRLFLQYDDQGNTKIGEARLNGKTSRLADNVGGTTIGRPYASGSFSVASNGTFAYTHTRPDRPADVAVGDGKTVRVITSLNDDLLGHKEIGRTEEFWFESSFDKRRIQGWIVTPPGFDKTKKYPLVLEIHGGPFANYGDRFSAEVQLYAAAGYVVVYINPRGSTGYGEQFTDLIHHAYPGHDFDDLMSGVDTVIGRGYVDADQLYVTGGSGGGVLTAWVVGKTNRFRAAVSAKPVINWYSFALTSDAYPFFYKYWFPGYPWEHPEEYHRRSPLSLVGNVTTPTMLLTGEVDYRTPMSESEQFYQALKLRKIDTALVRVPDASHAIARRPSNLIAKVAHILKWFELHSERP